MNGRDPTTPGLGDLQSPLTPPLGAHPPSMAYGFEKKHMDSQTLPPVIQWPMG